MRRVVAVLLLASTCLGATVRLHPTTSTSPLNQDVWAAADNALSWPDSMFDETSTAGRSYSLWVKPTGTTTTWGGIFLRGAQDAGSVWDRNPGLWMHANGYELRMHSGTGGPGQAGQDDLLDSVTSLALNKWNFVVFTHGNGSMSFYIDGALTNSEAAADPHVTDQPLKADVQGYPDANAFVWDLKFHNYVLSATEVSDMYASYSRTALSAFTRIDQTNQESDDRTAYYATTDFNPFSYPIHPSFTESFVVAGKSGTTYSQGTFSQDVSDLLGDGLNFTISAYFYQNGGSHEWWGVGPNGDGYNVNHLLGNYASTTHWSRHDINSWSATSKAMTNGWHKFTISRDGSGANTQYFVDDELVYQSTTGSTTAMTGLTYRSLNSNDIGVWSPFFASTSVSSDIDVSTTSIDFGEQNQYDGATAAQTVTITNQGEANLEITAIALSGTHAADFAITNAPGLPHTVGGGATLDLDVTFDPSSDGGKTASLDITSNDPDEGTVSVALAGQGGSGNPLLCEVSTATDPPTRFYRSSASDTCQASPTTANSCYYPEDKLATTFPTELRIVGPNAQAPLFADPVSRLANDGTDDRIYVAFNLPTKYYNHELVFADAINCGTWTLSDGFPTANTDSLGNCYLTYEWSQVWGDAYASDGSKCGWNRTVDGSDVELTLDFGIFAIEDVGDARGAAITRNVTFAHPMTVEFPTQVTAETSNIQVFSPVRTLAAVVGQQVTVDESTDPDTATLTVTLSTEVQAPFELHGITSNTVAPGITLVTTLNGANDENVRQEAECTNGALDCANTWQIQYSTQTTTKPCNFNGGYSVDFTIRCSDESDSNCPIDDATDSVTVSFTLASSDHCPTVIDSIVLSADLFVYDAPQRVTDADDFVGDGLQDDGQTAVNEGDADQWQVAYFTAPTSSTQVAIESTEFNQVWIERSSADDITLLDKDNSLGGGAVTCTATAYDDADNTASCGTETGLDSTTCQLIVPDIAFPDKCGAFDFAHRKGTSAAAGSASTPWFEFDINTGASGFNLANDAIETMTVHAVIDVAYANAAKRTTQSTTRRQHTNVAASISAGQTGTAASSSSSSATLFGMNAMVVYAGAAVVAIVAVAAITVSSRRRRSDNLTKLQSTTELTTTAV